MSLKLYELTGIDDLRFSPFCWRARLALAHKGLEPEIVPCKFTDKARIAFSNQKKVPVLVDGERVVPDSWDIACYLEEAYPERPSLFGGESGRQLSRFVHVWDDTRLKPALLRVIIKDLFEHAVHPDDRDYFRQSREERYGMTLEELHDTRDAHMPEVNRVLTPLRKMLSTSQLYLCGGAPAYADYAVFATFQWARLTSALEILQRHDPIAGWQARMLELFDGMARTQPAAA